MSGPQNNRFLTDEFPKAVAFYDNGAVRSKWQFRVLSIYLIAVSAVLTVLVAVFKEEGWWHWIPVVLSASMGVATGLLSHLKCQENWLSYRATWDALERERRLFEAGAGEYEDVAGKDSLFVERVEAIRTREGLNFYSRHAKGEEEAKKPDAAQQ